MPLPKSIRWFRHKFRAGSLGWGVQQSKEVVGKQGLWNEAGRERLRDRELEKGGESVQVVPSSRKGKEVGHGVLAA